VPPCPAPRRSGAGVAPLLRHENCLTFNTGDVRIGGAANSNICLASVERRHDPLWQRAIAADEAGQPRPAEVHRVPGDC
jgi:hypothetical protein